MPLLCFQSANAAVDPASSLHEALEGRPGNVVVATIDTMHDNTKPSSGDDPLLGLVLKTSHRPEWIQQQQQQQRHNKKRSSSSGSGSSTQTKQPHHAIMVDRIQPQSPFQKTPLREGMVLFQINHVNIENCSLSQVETFLQNIISSSRNSHHNDAQRRPLLRLWAQVAPSAPIPPISDNHHHQHHHQNDHQESIGRQHQHSGRNGAHESTRSNASSRSATRPVNGAATATTTGTTHTSSTTKSKNSKSSATTSSSNPRKELKTILAVAHKEEIDQTMGLSLRRSSPSGTFTVEEILPTSPFYPHDTSLLREGMTLSSINGLSITGMDMEVALSAIRDAPGTLLLAAEIPSDMDEPPMIRKRIVATIHKSSPDQPLGLSLIRIPLSGSVTSSHMNQKNQQFKTVVGRIAPNCPFRDTDLQVGFEITSVNGLNVAKSNARAILHYLQESWGKIVVLAEMDVPVDETTTTTTTTTSTNGMAMPNSSCSAGSQSQYSQSSSISPRPHPSFGTIGNTFPPVQHQDRPDQQHHHGQQHYPTQYHYPVHHTTSTSTGGGGSATETSALGSSYRTTGSSASGATGTAGATAGSVLMTALAVKHSPDYKLGMALDDDSLGSFFVSQIASDSPFQSSHLKVGAEVMSINGVQLPGLDMAFVSQLLRSIVGEVVLEFLLPPPVSSQQHVVDQRSSGGEKQQQQQQQHHSTDSTRSSHQSHHSGRTTTTARTGELISASPAPSFQIGSC